MCGGGGIRCFFPASWFFALGKGGVSVNLTVLRRSSFPMHISERMPLSLGFVAEHWRGNPFRMEVHPCRDSTVERWRVAALLNQWECAKRNKNSSGFNCSAIEALRLPQMYM